jgi:hypothetical protein
MLFAGESVLKSSLPCMILYLMCTITDRSQPSVVVFDVVDLYDGATRAWSTARLSVPRTDLAAASVDNVALFAGGYSLGDNTDSDVVDLYNVTTTAWSTAQLSVKRRSLAAASVGNVALFAGGCRFRCAFFFA